MARLPLVLVLVLVLGFPPASLPDVRFADRTPWLGLLVVGTGVTWRSLQGRSVGVRREVAGEPGF